MPNYGSSSQAHYRLETEIAVAGGAYMVPPSGMPCVRGFGLQSQHASAAALLRVEPPAFYHCQHPATRDRARLFDSDRFRRQFVATLAVLRAELNFKIIGYVLMPEHFHALIWPSERADPSRIVQSLKERTAKFILRNLQAHRELLWCGRMLAALTLPPTVHLHGPYRVWQRRFYDLNVWSEKKRREKLNYMYGNPVHRGMVTSPDQWSWSSFRFYFLKDDSVLPMDRLL